MLFLVALAASVPFYAAYRSMEHFLWHWGYGTAIGYLAGAVWAFQRRAPLRRPLLWPLAAYAWMVVPDLLWLGGLLATGDAWPHQPWMDLFFLHYSLDQTTWATAAVLPFHVAGLAAWLWADRRTGQA
ncbi:MAG: hypothetical protein ACPGQL_06210 [Thermoplasmatota archaeon]